MINYDNLRIVKYIIRFERFVKIFEFQIQKMFELKFGEFGGESRMFCC